MNADRLPLPYGRGSSNPLSERVPATPSPCPDGGLYHPRQLSHRTQDDQRPRLNRHRPRRRRPTPQSPPRRSSPRAGPTRPVRRAATARPSNSTWARTSALRSSRASTLIEAAWPADESLTRIAREPPGRPRFADGHRSAHPPTSGDGRSRSKSTTFREVMDPVAQSTRDAILEMLPRFT